MQPPGASLPVVDPRDGGATVRLVMQAGFGTGMGGPATFLSRLHGLGTELADMLMSGVFLSKSPLSVPADLLHLVKSCPHTRNKYTQSVFCVRENSSPEMWTQFLYFSITVSERKC